MSGTLPDALARICETTRTETARRRGYTNRAMLRSRIATNRDRPRSFAAALGEAVRAGRTGLIAEFKRRSPSAGAIRPEADPAAVARAYAEAGAACMSVLTDEPFFGGSAEDLATARGAVPLPILRKDFILDDWQVLESRALGADCILLIMAALAPAEARALEQTARDLDLDVLAEVHTRAELDQALLLQTGLIGINNRDLRTMTTALETTLALARHVPPDKLVVSESGIRDADDLARLRDAGVGCVLVGESLLRAPDPGAALRALLRGGDRGAA